GIEYEEFPARIAEVAMWLMDHQMNMMISNEFGQYFARLPLRKSAKIVHGNALQVNWEEVISKKDLSYIIGNPPFLGKSNQNFEQKKDLEKIFKSIKGAGVVDYVAAWYVKAAMIMINTKIKTAFVSTNSIVQGEQVGVLWNLLLNKYNIKIHFAHRTFSWRNEAKGNAAVHCVIIGFANFETNEKIIFDYDNIKGEPHQLKAKNINPYLVDGKDIILFPKEKTICDVPKIAWGNKPVDGGHLIISDSEVTEFLKNEPKAKKFIKPLISAKEFLNGQTRWCLWLIDAKPEELKDMPFVMERIKKVKEMRKASVDEGARKLALKPFQFRDIKNPDSYILIPSTTSENRKYIPFAFFEKDNIPHNSCHILPDGKLYHFGVLMSQMHMSWIKITCGRLKSDFRYSKDIVYNNYPWPENPSEKQIKTIEEKAQNVLDVRALFPASSLADLYSPLTMPPALVKAHNELDKAVDASYSKQIFSSEAKRMEFLFELYEKYTAGLFVKEKKVKKSVIK
ncbi:MAG: class I SAM-dependent DNA methyltransferase, partial [Flavobacterium sp.]|nr:class I SAM-dependent DNA methyltransferase [Flavobacterium sp.]